MIGGKLKEKFKGNLKGIYMGDIQGDEIPFEGKIIKTGSYTSGKTFPTIGLYRNITDLGSIDTIDYGTKYNEEFFKSKALIVIQLQEGSGAIRHEISNVVKNGDEITVQVNVIKPEFGTMDMAEWALFIEIDNSVVNDNTKVDFILR